MNYDELSFFNQQLGCMLRDGIPLEGALKRLCTGMRRGRFRQEMEALGKDLAQGTPLAAALSSRRLPDFYKRMVELGARSNDLPGLLTVLADHYHRLNTLWTRLKGLLVYPAVVIVLSLCITVIISVLFKHFLTGLLNQVSSPPMLLVLMWIPPFTLALFALLGIVAISWPVTRAQLRWRVPAFREASLAQLASSIAVMVRNGTTLADALALAQQLETGSPAAAALGHWRANVEAGAGKPALWGEAPPPFPPLFVWLIQQGGEDVASGFAKAAEIYRERANYRIELAMYGALPVSVLFLGLMIFWQMAPVIQSVTAMMKTLGDMGP